MKCNSFAIAQILGERYLRDITFCLLANEQEETEAEDDNSVEGAHFLSIARQLEAAKEPTEDMAVKVDAIYSTEAENRDNRKVLHKLKKAAQTIIN